MASRQYLSVALGLIGLLAVQCKKDSSEAKSANAEPAASTAMQLSLNDVSILIPIDQDINFVKATVDGSQNPDPAGKAPGLPALPAGSDAFLPTEMLAALDNQILADDVHTLPFKSPIYSYKLVAMRLDPCVNIRTVASSPDSCQAQLRLLWQPVSIGGNNMVQAADQNVHAIYNLTPDQFTEVIKTVAAAKAAATGFSYDDQPLGSNPLLSHQGPTGAYFTALVGIVHRYARRSNLAGVAGFFGATTAGWHMTAVTVKSGQPVLTTLGSASAKGATDNKYIVSLFSNPSGGHSIPLIGVTSPASVSPDNYTPFENVTEVSGTSANPFMPDENLHQQQLAAFPAYAAERLPHLYRIIDPMVHDVFDTDCASCHQASRALNLAHDRGVLPSDLSQVFKTPWNITNIASGPNMPLPDSLHMFSFFEGLDGVKAQVQARVITESAVVADFINRHYASTLQAH